MSKTSIHKIFSMTLALLVLLSTFSFKMETHFCGSNIVDVAVFSKVKSCCKTAIADVTPKLQFTKKSCCKNKVISVDGLKQFKIVPFLKELPTEKAFAKPSIFNSESVLLSFSVLGTVYNYAPPDRMLDFQVQHQVFLI